MATLTERIAALSPEQRALLFAQLQAQAVPNANTAHSPGHPTILPRPLGTTDPLPLSYSQQRLWFLQQFAAADTAYKIGIALQLDGPLQVDLLAQSLAAIIQRHESLRTRFARHNGDPIQVIDPTLPLPFQVLDWQTMAAAEIPAQLDQTLQTEVHHSFDLQQGPLLRVTLMRVAPHCHYLIAIFHHIVVDAWSMAVFIQELTSHYQAFLRQQPLSLSPLDIQAADHALWQQQWLQSPQAAEQLAYWQTQLADLPPVLELPCDRPRPSLQTFRGHTYPFTLSATLTQELKALARQTGTTLFMVLEAAFALMLSRFSRQTDVVIGTPVANRNVCELEPLIGFFLNTLVLRNDLSGNPTVLELLERTQTMALEAYRHQDIPFEQLVEVLKPARTLSHSPLFQVMFSLQNTPFTALELPDITLKPIPIPSQTAKFDLSLLVNETPVDGAEVLIAQWEYNCDLFDADTIERFAHCFERLLSQMVERPESPVYSLSLLSAAERQHILYDWNQTQTDFSGPPEQFLLHGGFEAQARQQPDAIAILYADQAYTYDQINDQADQLAHTLRSAFGVATPHPFIALYAERSPAAVIGLLAILKAGGTYIPLDPNYPQERIAAMLADAEPVCVLTQTTLADRLPPSQAVVLCLDDPTTFSSAALEPLLTGTISKGSALPLDPVSWADQLAYIIYTSGSTGKPKGVMITHRAAVNTILDINQRFAIGPGDRVISLASLSFDLSVYDIFGFLSAGGTLVIPQPQDALNPTVWLRLMHQHQVTFWDTAPAVMEMLMTTLTQTNPAQSNPTQPNSIQPNSTQFFNLPASLRAVMMSGDAISVSLPDTIRRYAQPNIQIYSFGGATEGSIWSICYPIGEVPLEWTSIPYGSPIANQRFHILDAHLNPVPIGVAGELHIGGDGVAQGYFKRPELTTERFIPDPFFPDVQTKLYKTGDLGCYRRDGTIQFLGRIDHQVKIRGFRIELAEIDGLISQYPGVRESTLLVREDQPGRKQLCAYVVPEENTQIDVNSLRQVLRQKLPDYMVPSFILILESLPLTSNGKVDRTALPAPEKLTSEAANFTPATTQLERLIAEVWGEFLQISPIGLHDNFFDLGGHSLMVVQVQTQLQLRLGREIEIVDLFQFPTIDQLAQHLENATSPANAIAQTQQRTELRTTQRSGLEQQRMLRQQFRRKSTDDDDE